jgi:hypothetical protein
MAKGMNRRSSKPALLIFKTPTRLIPMGCGLRGLSMRHCNMTLSIPLRRTCPALRSSPTTQAQAIDSALRLWVASGANAGKGYIFDINGTSGTIRRRDAATGVGSGLDASFGFTGQANGDEYALGYDPADGTLTAYHNGSSDRHPHRYNLSVRRSCSAHCRLRITAITTAQDR